MPSPRALKKNAKIPLSHDHLASKYGDVLDYLALTTNILDAAENCTEYVQSNSLFACDKNIQCDLLTEDGTHVLDPSRLSYEERLKWHFKEFCYKTSSHGIPMIGQAPNKIYRAVWIVLLLGCTIMFAHQASNVIEKFNRMDKITNILLKFDTAPFPAITLCNLNPYKQSLIGRVELVRRTLKVFNDVMKRAGKGSGSDSDAKIRKRSADASFVPAHSKCDCTNGESNICEAITDDVPTAADSMCLCAFDSTTGDAWPCFSKNLWTLEQCDQCDEHGNCLKAGTTTTNSSTGETSPCFCQPVTTLCIRHTPSAPITNLWEVTDDGEMKESATFLDALGFQGMTDQVAIVTKAKENVIFAMAQESDDVRAMLSIRKHELIQKCSFNGQACDIENDFLRIVDPSFGSCFTFNHNRSANMSSIRAGPMYGLRMLLYVNATEYLPTTEAVGVRLTIHDKDDFPFPDTFGYSAPTGYVSSFGMKLRRMSRLPAPYGDCVIDGKTSEYIFQDYRYSTEGCYRSCFQDLVLRECNCGDPRFPVLKGREHCYVGDPVARRCLDSRLKQLGGVHSSFRCRCQQPCDQSVYSVSYSAAIWPSESLEIKLGSCEDTPAVCNDHYQEHGAMVEVFYEALNFEMFSESEAYGFVKLMADFGGQLGLWSGVSFLTCFEFLFLLIETLYMFGNHHHQLRKREKFVETQKRNML